RARVGSVICRPHSNCLGGNTARSSSADSAIALSLCIPAARGARREGLRGLLRSRVAYQQHGPALANSTGGPSTAAPNGSNIIPRAPPGKLLSVAPTRALSLAPEDTVLAEVVDLGL